MRILLSLQVVSYILLFYNSRSKSMNIEIPPRPTSYTTLNQQTLKSNTSTNAPIFQGPTPNNSKPNTFTWTQTNSKISSPFAKSGTEAGKIFTNNNLNIFGKKDQTGSNAIVAEKNTTNPVNTTISKIFLPNQQQRQPSQSPFAKVIQALPPNNKIDPILPKPFKSAPSFNPKIESGHRVACITNSEPYVNRKISKQELRIQEYYEKLRKNGIQQNFNNFGGLPINNGFIRNNTTTGFNGFNGFNNQNQFQNVNQNNQGNFGLQQQLNSNNSYINTTIHQNYINNFNTEPIQYNYNPTHIPNPNSFFGNLIKDHHMYITPAITKSQSQLQATAYLLKSVYNQNISNYKQQIQEKQSHFRRLFEKFEFKECQNYLFRMFMSYMENQMQCVALFFNEQSYLTLFNLAKQYRFYRCVKTICNTNDFLESIDIDYYSPCQLLAYSKDLHNNKRNVIMEQCLIKNHQKMTKLLKQKFAAFYQNQLQSYLVQRYSVDVKNRLNSYQNEIIELILHQNRAFSDISSRRSEYLDNKYQNLLKNYRSYTTDNNEFSNLASARSTWNSTSAEQDGQLLRNKYRSRKNAAKYPKNSQKIELEDKVHRQRFNTYESLKMKYF